MQKATMSLEIRQSRAAACNNEMVSLGDTVSTYFNRHGGGGVLGKLRSELRKESWSFSFSGRGVFWVSSDLNSGKKVRVFHFQGGGRGVFWVSSDLNSGKKVRVFHFQGGGEGGVLGKLRSELRKES